MGTLVGLGTAEPTRRGRLAAQYLVYNFDELARQDRYRPWFELACPSLGCTLPSRVDISQIRSSNLVVRSHPDFEGALVVDAILYNRAPFAQPFPLLELRLPISTANWSPVAASSPANTSPANWPASMRCRRRSLSTSRWISSTGCKAVNYSLSFQSPE